MVLLAGCGAGGGGRTAPAGAGGPVPAVPTPTRAPTTASWSSVKPNALYARTDIGGAYRWDPTTMGWMPIVAGTGPGPAGSRFHGIDSVALDPDNDQPIYIATGKHTFEADGSIFVSHDRGDTWTHVDLPLPLGSSNPGRAMGDRPIVYPHLPSALFHGARTAGL